jgi:hypothetical protein
VTVVAGEYSFENMRRHDEASSVQTTISYASGVASTMSRRLFMLVRLEDDSGMLHRSNLIAWAYPTECDLVLSAKPINCEK